MSNLQTQITSQLNDYLASFNAGDFSAASSHYDEPAAAISSSGITILPSRSDFAALLETTVTRLRKEGFDHSEWIGEMEVRVLEDGGEKGLVEARGGCKRVRGDGSCVESFGVGYTLRKREGSWRVVAILQFPLVEG